MGARLPGEAVPELDFHGPRFTVFCHHPATVRAEPAACWPRPTPEANVAVVAAAAVAAHRGLARRRRGAVAARCVKLRRAWFCSGRPDAARWAPVRACARSSRKPSRSARAGGGWRQRQGRWPSWQLPAAWRRPGGGIAFAPDGASSPAWAGFAAASLIVPELSLARRGRLTWLTLNAEAAPDDTEDDVAGALSGAAARRCAVSRCRCSIPAPAGRYEVSSPMPPAHYEEAVARAVAADPRRRAREDRAGPRGRGPRAGRARPGRGPRAAARGVPILVRVRRRPRRRDLPRRHPGAAGPPRGSAGQHGRAGRLDPPQRRSRRRRPPRRAAAAQRQGPRGERDRRAPDRSRAAPALGVGDRGRPSRWWSRWPTSSTWPARSAPSWPRRSDAVELAGAAAPDAGRGRRARRGAWT